jgi:peptide/nickel transport system substrate-binding protein
MSLRTRRGLASLGAIIVIAAACASPTTTATPTAAGPTATTGGPTASAPVTGGGTLVMAEWQAASQLNPFFTSAFTNFEALGPVMHGLYTVDNDGNWAPDLGTEVPDTANGDVVPNPNAPADCTIAPLNPDSSPNPAATPTGDCFTLTLKLKPGLKWSDGAALTLADFKWTYDWAVATGKSGLGCGGCATFAPQLDPYLPGDAAWAPENQYVKSIDVSSDGLTATVVFQKNFSGYIAWAGGGFLPPQFWKNIALDQGNKAAAIDSPTLKDIPWSGPFIITAASADGIDYAPNPNWAGGVKPTLDGLRFRFYGSKDGEITAFLNGEVDLAFDMTQADYPAIQGVDAAVGKAELDTVWQYEHLDLNASRPGMSDLAVRTAIAQSIDKADLTSVLFPGAGVEPACSPAPPGTWWRSETVCPAYDPVAAAATLDGAGWKVDDATGLRTKDGVALRFKICTSSGNPTRLTTVGKISSYLRAIGIPTDIQTADASSVYFAGWADTTPQTECSIYRGTYDIALFAYVLSADLYGNYYYAYHSSQIPSDKNPNGSNDTRTNNKDLDAALAALGVELDHNTLKALAATMQTAYAATLAEIPLYYRAETTGVGVHVGGWVKYNPSSVGPTWNTETWTYVP